MHVGDLGPDQLVPGSVGDRPFAIDQASADDTRDQDLRLEQLVKLRQAPAVSRSREIARKQAPTQVLLGDCLRLRLDCPLRPRSDLVIDGPEDRQTGSEQDRAAVERETQHEPGRVLARLGQPGGPA